MKTIIFKPAVLLMMILATAFLSFNAEQSVGHGTLKIELAPGFTIEDIIQDLHDNAFVVTTGPAQGNSIYVLHFNVKIGNNEHLEQYLEAHPSVLIYHER